MPRSISIHALLAESDPSSSKTGRHFRYFYPRSPCGERRCDGRPQSGWTNISIHALLAESDCTLTWRTGSHLYFYPRSPCGERLTEIPVGWWKLQFLSTLSLRRATLHTTALSLPPLISIHALLAESDLWKGSSLSSNMISIHALLAESDFELFPKRLGDTLFLSTLSLRRATSKLAKTSRTEKISIHALLAESDQLYINRAAKTVVFLSTLSLRRATSKLAKPSRTEKISIHALLAESDRPQPPKARIL